ncbi:MAG: cytochrome c [Saprospiraceae bacterium]|nr:cytochrome c [Saprospiraceae bacterium]MCB0623969.1 cytochrome c [Saprospiraceae bacterium]MCB0676026.1 cytochrome c [Saprospiraceae bacterium]MCB0683575.1 cytochrome c [Saprospiraceae bacterium]
MKRVLFFLSIGLFALSCGGNSASEGDATGSKPRPQSMVADPDDGKGIGEIKNVELNDPLLPSMVASGKAIYEMKCAACHKLTDQRVVGPGWKGVTARRQPEWIMNMTTNVEVMLDKDPAARELLKECLVRMPNQNLSVGDARDVLEFMYANDGKEVGS